MSLTLRLFSSLRLTGSEAIFHQQWQKAEAGESEYQAIFVPWYWQDEYVKPVPEDFATTAEEEELQQLYKLTDAQLVWRRFKIAELSADGIDGTSAFQQEYPMTATEAFQISGEDTLISPANVTKARKVKCLGSGPLKIGVDPARFGSDRTAIVRRRNRAVWDLKTYSKKSTMEVAGIVHSIIKKEKPAQVAIDVGGLGAGVVDRLYELGHEEVVVAINFGSAALDPERYYNRRAEMWATMNKWLDGDLPVMIPDKDELHTDLCSPKYSYDSNTRLKLEKKEDMVKRGLRSPDCGDAIALTFAEPVVPKEPSTPVVQTVVADPVAGY